MERRPLSRDLIKRLRQIAQASVMKKSLALIANSEQTSSEDTNEEDACELLDSENPALGGHFLMERTMLDVTVVDSCVCTCHNDQTMTFQLTLPFSCSKCSQQFCCKCQFLVHREFHRRERKYECKVCGKGYYYKSDLMRHHPVHSQNKPHVCKVCGRSFNQVGHLITHRLVHTGEKPFTCDVCNKSFNRKSNLQKHKMIHTGERPFQCFICESRFSRKGDLQRHTMLHTGERPYKCDVCEKTFSQKPHLVSHRAIHTGERPYKCLACSRSFHRKNHLLKHQIEKCPELSLNQASSDLSLPAFSNMSPNVFFNNINHMLTSKLSVDSEESTVEKSCFSSLNLKPNLQFDSVEKSKEEIRKDQCKQVNEMSLLRAILDPSYARSRISGKKQSKSVAQKRVKLEIGEEKLSLQNPSKASSPPLLKMELECDKTETKEALSADELSLETQKSKNLLV